MLTLSLFRPSRPFASIVLLMTGVGLAESDAQEPVQIGDFYYRESKDPHDGTDRSTIHTLAKPGVQVEGGDALFSPGGDAALAWQCLPDGMDVFYMFPYVGGSEEQVEVRYHIDSNPPSDAKRWDLLIRGKTAAAIMPTNEVPGFTDEAKAGSEVVFRVTDLLDGNLVYASEFGLVGLTEALKRLPCAPR